MASFRINENARFRAKLCIVGHVPHWIGSDGDTWAYEPYVREIRIWADLFSQVTVCSPKGEGPTRGNLAPYCRSNVVWKPVAYHLGSGQIGLLRRLSQLPGVTLAVWHAIKSSDFINLRSPGHFSLIGTVLARVMKKPSLTKWAGVNRGYRGEPLACKLERYLQSIPSELHPVLVYGPARRPHHISFFPALMSDEELEIARRMSSAKVWAPPWRILCVGRLSGEKRFDLAIHGLGELKREYPDIAWRLKLVGDGPERKRLETLTERCGVADRVTFTGALTFREVQGQYAASHVLIQPNANEGWPKVVAEAWAHGAIPVTARGWTVSHIMRDENAGVMFEANATALAKALANLLGQPERMRTMANAAYARARGLSLEQFRTSLEQVLVERCGLK